MRDIAGLNLNPLKKTMELYLAEKSQIQALDRAQAVLPKRPAQPRGARKTTPANHR